jgi:hypothetical protein
MINQQFTIPFQSNYCAQAVNGFALSLYKAGASAIRKSPARGDEQLMTIEDLAAYFKVKTQTLYDWA